MAKYRNALPQMSGEMFLTDGGIETCLIFHDGLELPYFAAFTLLDGAAGRQALRDYFGRYAQLAVDGGHGFILESPTWRASADWGEKLGYDAEAMARVNRDAIALMAELRDRHETPASKFVVSGCIGPRGDGYDPGAPMDAGEARAYHGAQIAAFAEAGADMVTAITMTNVPEATGLALAARDARMPCAISFTTETDGRLPSGEALGAAVAAVDAATGDGPAYYMINCAHPSHFEDAVTAGGAWRERVRGVRANASTKSHAELDESETLDEGDPDDLGRRLRALARIMPNLTVFGGCCGTDHRHVATIRDACVQARAA
ncbi:homocysteine S-methyltransferase family protein [Microbaculum marinisediminis]|uniref:Homocysteine S-methyltransferase family protein n=1 Tax=Microbaculum marinisediminis TaxID=2931392 RepID=A0AAW5QWZ6_9HYPH|nr:homocysteine S-methyltransferase family protein [Microbaculum sp. A6E488]MCT8972243.1 homocysteine S-methyltransferase family protein [Microbaculum sp. A6E488]